MPFVCLPLIAWSCLQATSRALCFNKTSFMFFRVFSPAMRHHIPWAEKGLRSRLSFFLPSLSSLQEQLTRLGLKITSSMSACEKASHHHLRMVSWVKHITMLQRSLLWCPLSSKQYPRECPRAYKGTINQNFIQWMHLWPAMPYNLLLQQKYNGIVALKEWKL